MILHIIFQWLNPIIPLVGLIIAISAFKKCSKKGYLIIATYYALAVFSLLAMPKINRVIAQSKKPDLNAELREEMNQEILTTYERYYGEKGLPPKTHIRHIQFPLGQIILLAGLWMIANKEKNPNHH